MSKDNNNNDRKASLKLNEP